VLNVVERLGKYSHRLGDWIEEGIEWFEREWKRRYPTTLEEVYTYVSNCDAYYGPTDPNRIVRIFSRETGVKFNPDKNTLICPKCNAETPVILNPIEEVHCQCGEGILPETRKKRAPIEFALAGAKERHDREGAYYSGMHYDNL
jgi:hypothetical protein